MFVAAGALLLFASARAQSIALPVAGMIALLLPVPALLVRRWRRPPLYLVVGATYALLAGIVALAGNDVTTIVSTGFALAAFALLGAAIAISVLDDLTVAVRRKADIAPTAVDEFVGSALSQRGLRVLAAVTIGLAVLVALSAGAPGLVWGSHAIGQLTSLAARPWLGWWWGVLVALDGVAGGIAVYFTARKLGASTPAAAIAGLLWATCPARVWPQSLALAPTFLLPLFCWALIENGERNTVTLSVMGAALLLATVLAPAEALAMVAVGTALALTHADMRARLLRNPIAWLPWSLAAAVYVVFAPHAITQAFAASGALLGSPDTVRGLAGDGALPWEAAVPAAMLSPLFATEHHAGVIFALCISPGFALIAAAIAFAILRPSARGFSIGRGAALAIAFSLFVALPSQWGGVGLPTLAALFAVLMPTFAGIAQAGLGISVICALLGALALDALFARTDDVWRSVGAALVGLAVVAAPLQAGPGASRIDSSPTIAAQLWAAANARGGSIAYYPLMDATTPRGAELAYVESVSGTRVADLHMTLRDRARLSDISEPSVASALRALGVKVVIVEGRAYGDPIVTPALSQWVWLPGDLRTARQLMPRIPNEFSPIQAFDDGAIVVYKL